jgi:nitroimidazol reductase NimA-like FMN-containing flavoprotein (pyridoxamine 5'-phosphate oxidase superfamily)
MTVYEVDSLLLDPDEKPCDTNTKYESVIVSGKAIFVDNLEIKKGVLAGIVEKYTPHLIGKKLPDNMVMSTAVVKIEVQNMTGKYYE